MEILGVENAINPVAELSDLFSARLTRHQSFYRVHRSHKMSHEKERRVMCGRYRCEKC